MQGFKGGFNADLSFQNNANHGNYGRGGYRYFKKNNYRGGSWNNFNLGRRAENFGSRQGGVGKEGNLDAARNSATTANIQKV
jgi:hypothetical protein